MKKTLMLLGVAAGMLAVGACTNNQTTAPVQVTGTDDDVDVVYSGVLPSADTDGVRYTLLLDFDDEGKDGDYQMVQTYFMTDSTGVEDVATFATEGDFTVQQRADGKKYLKFDGKGAGDLYFLIDTDSTLVMTDETATPAATPGLNYTLNKAK